MSMCVTSTTEVSDPSVCEFIAVFLDDAMYLRKTMSGEPFRGHRQFDVRLEPELGIALPTCDVHMFPALFQRKEVEAVAFLSENRGAHV